jgi:flagellar biosynthesis/type III secretory pathway M-ring protein FliF/YscJ
VDGHVVTPVAIGFTVGRMSRLRMLCAIFMLAGAAVSKVRAESTPHASRSAIEFRDPSLAVESAGAAVDQASPIDSDPQSRARRKSRAYAAFAFYALLILIAFVFIVWAMSRFSKRYSAYVLARERRPTPNQDVWAMHKLPADAISGGEGDWRLEPGVDLDEEDFDEEGEDEANDV